MQDLIATAQRVLAGEDPEDVRRLTRRRRHAVVAWDIVAGWAVVEILRRGHSGQPEDESLTFELVGSEWQYRGGGGGSGDEDPFADRPNEKELGAPFRFRGSSGHNATPGRILPFGSRQVRSESYDVAAEVESIEVRSRGSATRTIPVRRHGHAVVLWAERRPPTIAFLDSAGRELATRRPEGNRRMWSIGLPFSVRRGGRHRRGFAYSPR